MAQAVQAGGEDHGGGDDGGGVDGVVAGAADHFAGGVA